MDKEKSSGAAGKLASLWRDLFQASGQEKKAGMNRFLLLILLLGIILMFAGPFLSRPQKPVAIKEEEKILPRHVENETDLAVALENILEHIDGISNVQVLINYAAGKEGIYAFSVDESKRVSQEMDREGGTREVEETNRREEQVLFRNAGGGEEALLLKEIMPEIKGVLVVARGAENIYLQLEVVRAIQSVLQLPAHRIAVLPYGN